MKDDHRGYPEPDLRGLTLRGHLFGEMVLAPTSEPLVTLTAGAPSVQREFQVGDLIVISTNTSVYAQLGPNSSAADPSSPKGVFVMGQPRLLIIVDNADRRFLTLRRIATDAIVNAWAGGSLLSGPSPFFSG